MRYLHTMIRATNLDDTLDFFVDKLGLVEAYRYDNEAGRFTLVFLSAPADLEAAKSRQAPLVEITHNWDPETYDGGRNFGHLAYQVDDIYATSRWKISASGKTQRPRKASIQRATRAPSCCRSSRLCIPAATRASPIISRRKLIISRE